MPYTYYVLAFVDLLGQSNMLGEIKAVADSDDEFATIVEGIKSAGSKIKTIRDYFDRLVLSNTAARPEVLNEIPPEERELFLKVHSFQIRQIGFSDSFLISVPIYEEKAGLAWRARGVHAVWFVLRGIAGISLYSLSLGIPLRGGVDLGLGVDLFPTEVYGPVLLSAYKLESQGAEYPRTLVGANLIKFLRDMEASPQVSAFDKYAAAIASECRTLICNAPDDGRLMLHILSPSLEMPQPFFTDIRRTSAEWVKAQMNKYKNEKNEFLYGRYSRLARYFEVHGVNLDEPYVR